MHHHVAGIRKSNCPQAWNSKRQLPWGWNVWCHIFWSSPNPALLPAPHLHYITMWKYWCPPGRPVISIWVLDIWWCYFILKASIVHCFFRGNSRAIHIIFRFGYPRRPIFLPSCTQKLHFDLLPFIDLASEGILSLSVPTRQPRLSMRFAWTWLSTRLKPPAGLHSA